MTNTAAARGTTRSRAYPEGLRCVMCVLVVLGHAQLSLISLAILAVAGFLTISTVFSIDAFDASRTRARIRTILTLWLVWWIPYCVLLCARGMSKGVGPFGLVEPSMILTGPAIHLWYLPALAATSAVLLVLGSAVDRVWVVCLATVVAISIASASYAQYDLSVTPLPQVLVAAFVFCTSIVATRVLPRAISGLGALCGALAIVGSLVLGVLLAHDWPAYVLMVFGTVALCRARQPAPPHWLVVMASLTGGIYLVHFLVLMPLHKAEITGVWLFTITLVASAAVTALARRTRLRRFFL